MIILTVFTILALVLLWLFIETQFLPPLLSLPPSTKGRLGDIGDIMMKGIAWVFIAIGLIHHKGFISYQKKYPAILISPDGVIYKGFNANQVKHICKRLLNWHWEFIKVILVSPNGKRYPNFNGLRAERICRNQPEWSWQEMTGENSES